MSQSPIPAEALTGSAPIQPTPAMPPWIKAVQYAIAAILALPAIICAAMLSAGPVPVSGLWLPLFCLLTSVGLLRRLAWARFVVSCLSVLATLFSLALLLPDPYGRQASVDLGQMPLSLAVLLVVLCTTLILLPALFIGWRKHWFRQAWW